MRKEPEPDYASLGGWFRTGDVAVIDRDGYVTVKDRLKDLIKSGGEWISSIDLENALMTHPAIREAMVVSVPRPTWQERPVALLRLAYLPGRTVREVVASGRVHLRLVTAQDEHGQAGQEAGSIAPGAARYGRGSWAVDPGGPTDTSTVTVLNHRRPSGSLRRPGSKFLDMTKHPDLLASLGIEVPIVQAPIGSATTVALAAAVSAAGALGTLAMSWRSADRVRDMLRKLGALTDRPYAVNFVLEWDMRERVSASLEEGATIISFFWGDPEPYVAEVHAAGAVVMHTVGSVEEARRAVGAGVDVIVAQGWEAGGHVRGEVTTMALVPAVVDAVGELPVIAAGGIADGRGVAAALALGAAGAMIGTRFVASEEANTHPAYRQAVCAAGSGDTAHTLLFEGGWPNAPHRALKNATYRRWTEAGRPSNGARPGEGDVIATRRGVSLLRYGDDLPTADAQGAVEDLAMYAGQGVSQVTAVEPAADIVTAIWRQACEVRSAT